MYKKRVRLIVSRKYFLSTIAKEHAKLVKLEIRKACEIEVLADGCTCKNEKNLKMAHAPGRDHERNFEISDNDERIIRR